MGSCVERLPQSRCLVVVEKASLGKVSVTFRGWEMSQAVAYVVIPASSRGMLVGRRQSQQCDCHFVHLLALASNGEIGATIAAV